MHESCLRTRPLSALSAVRIGKQTEITDDNLTIFWVQHRSMSRLRFQLPCVVDELSSKHHDHIVTNACNMRFFRLSTPAVFGVLLVICTFGGLCSGDVAPPAAEKKLTIPTFDVQPVGKMPQVGLGTWQAKDDELEKALESALEAGYRHIDTAFVYENEKVIGRVLKKWMDSGKLKREDLFIVTKLPPAGNRPSGVSKYLKRSLDDLQLDYVDMYLIHTPFAFAEGDEIHPMKDGKIMLDNDTDHVAIWKAMEEQVDAGKAKAIGLSNFNIAQVTRVLENARIKPANLQIELHAYHQQVPLVDFAKKHGIIITAYSPLGAPGLGKFMDNMNTKAPEMPKILENPIVGEIAKKHDKSPAQILLRHGIQKGLIVIPKSTNPGRLRQNLDVFDFELDDSDMTKMNNLDLKARFIDFQVFPGIDEHPEYPFKKN